MSPLDKSTRREFMVTTSSAALGAVVPLAGAQPDAPVSNPLSVPVSEEIPYSSEELFDNGPQRTFSGDSATQIAMPLGGIGAGCICLNGYGGLQDFSIGITPQPQHYPRATLLPKPLSPFSILKGRLRSPNLWKGPSQF